MSPRRLATPLKDRFEVQRGAGLEGESDGWCVVGPAGEVPGSWRQNEDCAHAFLAGMRSRQAEVDLLLMQLSEFVDGRAQGAMKSIQEIIQVLSAGPPSPL